MAIQNMEARSIYAPPLIEKSNLVKKSINDPEEKMCSNVLCLKWSNLPIELFQSSITWQTKRNWSRDIGDDVTRKTSECVNRCDTCTGFSLWLSSMWTRSEYSISYIYQPLCTLRIHRSFLLPFPRVVTAILTNFRYFLWSCLKQLLLRYSISFFVFLYHFAFFHSAHYVTWLWQITFPTLFLCVALTF